MASEALVKTELTVEGAGLTALGCRWIRLEGLRGCWMVLGGRSELINSFFKREIVQRTRALAH